MAAAQRIVSLLPSTTEIVCALGLREQLVGRSHECDYPAGVQSLPALTAARLDWSSRSRSSRKSCIPTASTSATKQAAGSGSEP